MRKHFAVRATLLLSSYLFLPAYKGYPEALQTNKHTAFVLLRNLALINWRLGAFKSPRHRIPFKDTNPTRDSWKGPTLKSCKALVPGNSGILDFNTFVPPGRRKACVRYNFTARRQELLVKFEDTQARSYGFARSGHRCLFQESSD